MLTKIMRVVYQYGGLQEKHALMLGIPSNRWKKELKEQSLLLNAAI
jgi:DNA-binding protein Fis